MKAITVNNIPPQLQAIIEHHDLDHLAGTWSPEEAREFEAALTEQRQIDPELWE